MAFSDGHACKKYTLFLIFWLEFWKSYRGLRGKQSQINEIQASYIGAFTVPLSWSISNYKVTCLLRNGLYHKINNREPNKIGIGE